MGLEDWEVPGLGEGAPQRRKNAKAKRRKPLGAKEEKKREQNSWNER